MGWIQSLGPDHRPGDWTPSRNGNPTRVEHGAFLTVFYRGTGWRWSCLRRWLKKTPVVFSPRTFATIEQAQADALEAAAEFEAERAPVLERNRARRARLRAERQRQRIEKTC